MNRRFILLFPALLLIGFVYPSVSSASANREDQDARAGAVLFRDKGCITCHGEAGTGTKKAPSLAGIRDDKAWPPEKITDQILNGGKKMPPFRDALSDDEIAKLVAYLRTKDKPVPPPAAQGSAAIPPSQ